MRNNIALSLCIPTNGIIEWVVPVIDSIYVEKSPVGAFEVIVTDNGNNDEFAELMKKYSRQYKNFNYVKTEAYQFLNQIEAFKLAQGNMIKFVNHRTKLLPGALNAFIKYSLKNCGDKPVTYFLNDAKKMPRTNNEYYSFDDFVRNLSYWSSWSCGTTMWKSDFDNLNLESPFNLLFPHTNLIFSEKNKNRYVINNQKLMEEIPVDLTQKGKYDLFNAFAVEYVRIIKELYNSGNISKDTYEYVKKQNGTFVAQLYFDYVLRKIPCSYDLSGFDEAVEIYYSKWQIKKQMTLIVAKKIINKLRTVGGWR